MPKADRKSSFPAGPCPYLPDREWWIRTESLPPLSGSTEHYEDLLSAGWRRNGYIVYQNHCPGCSRCIPLRVPSSVQPATKSHRRLGKKNQDLQVIVSEPRVTQEFIDLYLRYQEQRHDDSSLEPEGFENFFCRSGVDTQFMEYRDSRGVLLGLGLVDLFPNSISSVYFVFDPLESRRSLGIYSLYREVELVRKLGKGYLHLGFWVPGSPKWNTKGVCIPTKF